MEHKHYPVGNEILDQDNLITAPVLADIIELIRSNNLDKSISVTNLFKQAGIAKGLDLELLASGAIDPSLYTWVKLDHSSVKIEATIAAPVAGKFLIISQIDSGTAAHTVTLTAGTWDGTLTIATFNALGETLILFGVTATRYVIVENVGAVGLS